MNTPINNRKKFFEYLHEGLQQYFDRHNKKFHGMLYFAVGVKNGRVEAIIRRDSPLPFAPKTHVGDGLYVGVAKPPVKR